MAMALILGEAAVVLAVLSAVVPLFFLRRPLLHSRLSFFLLGFSGLAAVWRLGSSFADERTYRPAHRPTVVACLSAP